MKIVKVDTIHLCIPLKKPFSIAGGTIKAVNHIVVKVHTDEGLVGIGSAHPLPAYSEATSEEIEIIINKYLKPATIGEDVFDIEKIIDKMNASVPGHTFAKAAIDLALYDLMGKTLGVPVFKLLGGEYREKCMGVNGAGIGSPDEMAKEAIASIKQGYQVMKIKVGTNPEEDIKRVKAVREAIGDAMPLRVDANQGYSPAVAIKTIKKMERYELEGVEQPVRRWDLDGMARVARAVDTPIIADESVFTPQDAINVIRKEAADVFSIKLMKPGGLYNAKKIASIAEAADVPCLIGGMIDSGIGVAANRHFATATKIVGLAGEGVDPPTDMLEDDILKDPLTMEKGYAMAPRKPGLGVEIDSAKLRKYQIG